MVLVRRFPADPAAAPAARRMVQMTTPEMPKDKADDACLVATELVTNAVKYGVGPIEFRIRFGPGRPFRIEVLDQGRGFEPQVPPSPPPAGDTSGWGLYLVDRLVDRWGMDPRAGATWAEFEPSHRRTLR